MKGPQLVIMATCQDCQYAFAEKSVEHFGDYYVVDCHHPSAAPRTVGTNWRTPGWCPVLAAARAALGRKLVKESE